MAGIPACPSGYERSEFPSGGVTKKEIGSEVGTALTAHALD